LDRDFLIPRTGLNAERGGQRGRFCGSVAHREIKALAKDQVDRNGQFIDAQVRSLVERRARDSEIAGPDIVDPEGLGIIAARGQNSKVVSAFIDVRFGALAEGVDLQAQFGIDGA